MEQRPLLEETLMRSRLEWVDLGKPDSSQFEKLESLMSSKIKYPKRDLELEKKNYEKWKTELTNEGTHYIIVRRYRTIPEERVVCQRVDRCFLESPGYKFLYMGIIFPIFEEV